MKILLANKFYYRRGGDCIYMLNLEQMFKQHNHDVAVFAMDYPENINSPWKEYFPSEVSFHPGLGILETLKRPFGSAEVRKKFTQLLDDFQPDVVHLSNIHTQLSPVIAELAHNRGIKIIWTLHDYKLLCPRYDCLRNGKFICEKCFTNKKNVLKYRCMKNSLLASIIAYKEAKTWYRERIEKITDVFVCPSQFMADKMLQGGYNKAKIHRLCNFIDVTKCTRDSYEKSNYYCYVGRLSNEKGVKTLIEAANELSYKLVIIGDGPLIAELKSTAGKNIEFVGFKQWDEIKDLVGKARFTVVPSEWYENNPLSVIEAKCLGTPVLGARIGGIPELINEGSDGMTFASCDANDLRQKIQEMMGTSFNYENIAKESQEKYNDSSYYNNLLAIYKDCLNK